MGLFDKLFGHKPKVVGQYNGVFKLLDGYSPRFTKWNGKIYESELIRAAINARATHISKLKVEIMGSAKPSLKRKLQRNPNSFQTWSQFLYRLSTILDIHNTAFIVPIWDEYGEISGIYCPLPEAVELVQYGNEAYLRYEFAWGEKAAVELSWCGIMTKFQYSHDFFGERNNALNSTLELLDIQKQGIEEGIKSTASYKFMANLTNFAKAEDLKKERERFTAANFGKDAESRGLLLFPNTYSNIQQITTKPFVIDAETEKVIKSNVYEYYNVNEDILEAKAYGDKWSAFYEGVVEAFAIQFSEVMTKMLYTFREQGEGNMVMATANRLQYMSNAEKLNVSSQMLDRGIMSINEVREIWNLSPVDGGDRRIIRGEYYDADQKMGEDSNEDGNQSV